MEITWTLLTQHLAFTEEKEACGRGRSLYSRKGLHLTYWLGHGWMWQVCKTTDPDPNQWLPLKNVSVRFIVRVLKALGDEIPLSLEETVNFVESGKFKHSYCWKLLSEKLSETMALNVSVNNDRIIVINLNGGRNQRLFRIHLRQYRDKGSDPVDRKKVLGSELYNLPITNASSLLAKCLDIIKQSSFAEDILGLTIDDSEPNESYARFHTFEGWQILGVTNESNEE